MATDGTVGVAADPQARVALRVVGPNHYGFIQALELAPGRLESYRHRAKTPPPEQFAQSLWQGVVAQFLVERAADHEPLGLVACYGTEFRHRYARIAVIGRDDTPMSRALVTEGLELFIDYLFNHFDFRKLYAQVLAPNMSQFQTMVGRYVDVEGVMVGHEFFAGDWVDSYTLAIHRSKWPGRAERDSAVRRRQAKATAGDPTRSRSHPRPTAGRPSTSSSPSWPVCRLPTSNSSTTPRSSTRCSTRSGSSSCSTTWNGTATTLCPSKPSTLS